MPVCYYMNCPWGKKKALSVYFCICQKVHSWNAIVKSKKSVCFPVLKQINSICCVAGAKDDAK